MCSAFAERDARCACDASFGRDVRFAREKERDIRFARDMSFGRDARSAREKERVASLCGSAAKRHCLQSELLRLSVRIKSLFSASYFRMRDLNLQRLFICIIFIRKVCRKVYICHRFVISYLL